MDSATQVIITRNTLRLSGNPAFGLHWGSRLHLSAHGPPGLTTLIRHVAGGLSGPS